uniref:G-protein coupled receptors family 1 profile domain-containing protein n=1 Tax=Romanomermis culicivorax TaxID=13658 RepID=A0A915IYI2_ROMCU
MLVEIYNVDLDQKLIKNVESSYSRFSWIGKTKQKVVVEELSCRALKFCTLSTQLNYVFAQSIYEMNNFTEYNNISATSSLDHQPPAKFEIIFFACLFAFIAFLGVLGNCLVILAVGLDSKMRKSVMNILLLNLAAADLCNLIACAPDIAIQIMQSGWTLPPFTCPLLRYLEIVSLYCSLLTQLALANGLRPVITLLCANNASVKLCHALCEA